MAAGYTIYEILRTLTMRVGWSSQAEQEAVLSSIAEMERVNLFGNMATIIECPHTNKKTTGDWRRPVTKCLDCGRELGT